VVPLAAILLQLPFGWIIGWLKGKGSLSTRTWSDGEQSSSQTLDWHSPAPLRARSLLLCLRKLRAWALTNAPNPSPNAEDARQASSGRLAVLACAHAIPHHLRPLPVPNQTNHVTSSRGMLPIVDAIAWMNDSMARQRNEPSLFPPLGAADGAAATPAKTLRLLGSPLPSLTRDYFSKRCAMLRNPRISVDNAATRGVAWPHFVVGFGTVGVATNAKETMRRTKLDPILINLEADEEAALEELVRENVYSFSTTSIEPMPSRQGPRPQGRRES
jgi:hypothetical protein